MCCGAADLRFSRSEFELEGLAVYPSPTRRRPSPAGSQQASSQPAEQPQQPTAATAPAPAASTVGALLRRPFQNTPQKTTTERQLHAGLSALADLIDDGVISAEEGIRRKTLLVKFTSIQDGTDDDDDDADNDSDADNNGDEYQRLDCFARLHRCWRRFFWRMYFIEQAD